MLQAAGGETTVQLGEKNSELAAILERERAQHKEEINAVQSQLVERTEVVK